MVISVPWPKPLGWAKEESEQEKTQDSGWRDVVQSITCRGANNCDKHGLVKNYYFLMRDFIFYSSLPGVPIIVEGTVYKIIQLLDISSKLATNNFTYDIVRYVYFSDCNLITVQPEFGQ